LLTFTWITKIVATQLSVNYVLKRQKKITILRNNNSSKLWRHLENEHNNEYKLINDKQKKNKEEKFNNRKLRIDPITKLFGVQKGVASKEAIDLAIENLIFLDTQPYSIVEDLGFQAPIKLAFPHYELEENTSLHMLPI
jgi:hypothetical protein